MQDARNYNARPVLLESLQVNSFCCNGRGNYDDRIPQININPIKQKYMYTIIITIFSFTELKICIPDAVVVAVYMF